MMTTAAEEYTASSATHRFHHQLINDKEYLFRLSSTFAWEESIEFCNTCIFHVERAAAAATAAATTTDNNSNSSSNNSNKIEYYDEDPHKHTNNTSLHTKIHSLSLQQYIQYIHLQLTYIDQWGNTCLHAQCFCKPPVESVSVLFRLARLLQRRFSLCDTNDNISNNNNNERIIWATTCKDGSTPFHIAASTGASPEVLHCYISEIQYYIDQKWLSLSNDTTTTNSNSSYSEEWARKTIIRPDISGNTPLMGWMSHHYKWIKYQLDNLSSGIFTMSSSPHLLSNYWNLAERMLRFATTTTMVDENENENDSVTTTTTTTTLELMQQCASISMYCPVSLLEWIVSPHRNGRSRCDNTIETSSSSSLWTAADVCAATPNETTGKLPFHVAMEAIPFQFDYSSSSSGRKELLRYTTNNPRLEMNRIQILKKLLIWYPHAANVPFRLMKSVAVAAISTVAADKKQQDHDNVVEDDDDEKKRMVRSRSPFLQAIAFGGSWWCTMKADGTTTKDENDDVDNYMGLVQLLWRMNHHPGEIISKRDEVTGLYPFMLAGASSSSCDADNSDDDTDTAVVDTTYNLLRKDPQLVAGALSYGK